LAKTVRAIGLREALPILQGERIERIDLSVRVRLLFLTSLACRATLAGARDVGIPGWRQSSTRQDLNLPGRKPVHVNGIERTFEPQDLANCLTASGIAIDRNTGERSAHYDVEGLP
jgi:hypothetical protein